MFTNKALQSTFKLCQSLHLSSPAPFVTKLQGHGLPKFTYLPFYAFSTQSLKDVIRRSSGIKPKHAKVREVAEYQQILEKSRKDLETVLSKGSSSGIEKANAYFLLGDNYRLIGNYQEALENLESGLNALKSQADKEVESRLLNSIGLVHSEQHHDKTALEYFNKAIEARKAANKGSDPLTGVMITNVADITFRQGKIQESLDLYKEAKKTLENDPQLISDYASCLVGMGQAYMALEGVKDSNALNYFRQALDLKRKNLGENHSEVAEIYTEIGRKFYEHGNFDIAIENIEKAHKIYSKIYSEDTHIVSTVLRLLGRAYIGKGDYPKATELHQKALEIEQNRTSASELDIAEAKNDLAQAYIRMNYYDDAINVAQEALSKIRQKDEIVVADLNNTIGRALRKKGHYKEAHKYYKIAIKLQLKLLGEEHRQVGRTCNTLGIVHIHLKNYRKALNFFNTALKINKARLGDRNVETGSTYMNIGRLQLTQGFEEKAIESFMQALSIYKLKLGDDHYNVASTCENLALCFFKLKQYDNAINYYQTALNIYNNHPHYTGNHPVIIHLHNTLGMAYSKKGSNAEALGHYFFAIEMLTNFEKKHVEMAFPTGGAGPAAWGNAEFNINFITEYYQLYNNVASIYLKQKKYQKAIEYYQKSVDVSEHMIDKKNQAKAYNLVGNAYFKAEEYDLAVENFNKALKLYADVLVDHVSAGKTLLNIGNVEEKRGAFTQAVEAVRDAKQFMVKVLADNHPSVGSVDRILKRMESGGKGEK